jgi:hypothetical protein
MAYCNVKIKGRKSALHFTCAAYCCIPPRSFLTAWMLGPQMKVLHCSENNVYKVKSSYTLTWFVVVKIHKSEVSKSRDRCIRNIIRCADYLTE